MATRRRGGTRQRSGPRSHCRYCGADVYWLTCIKVDGTLGAKAPIDVAVSFEGNIEVDVAGGTYRVVSKDRAAAHRAAADAGTPPSLRLNHFVTCTNVTYRSRRGRVHAPTPDEADAQDAWAADAAQPALAPPVAVIEGPGAPVVIPLQEPFGMVDPEEELDDDE